MSNKNIMKLGYNDIAILCQLLHISDLASNCTLPIVKIFKYPKPIFLYMHYICAVDIIMALGNIKF